MRLLHTTSHQFREFIDATQAPSYAILSHKWGDDELTYKEYSKGLRQEGAGYKKIMDACKFAHSQDLRWIWIDTCCVDKKSSAELTESLNSMYEWYRRSTVCYAYLHDVKSGQNIETLGQSIWFTRGWTLQELVAPHYVLFLSEDWKTLGYKGIMPEWAEGGEKRELHVALSAITRIPEDVLNIKRLPRSASVAQRMSWIASRTTTRPEDMAYCLLGIFGVNMPVLYGEGIKAFERLQLEIMSRNSDESIFAWIPDQVSAELKKYTGMLAPEPLPFKESYSIVVAKHHDRPPNMLTNRGLEMRLHRTPRCQIYANKVRQNWLYLVINCTASELMPMQQPDLDGFTVVLCRVSCGHYNRVTGHGRPVIPRQGWYAFGGDEVIYVHLTESDALLCPDRANAELPPLPPPPPTEQ